MRTPKSIEIKNARGIKTGLLKVFLSGLPDGKKVYFKPKTMYVEDLALEKDLELVTRVSYQHGKVCLEQ